MIRKILFFITLAVMIAWFSGAYLIKSKVSVLLSNIGNDNIKLSYEKIVTSGFPFAWRASIINPKITLINNLTSTQFATSQIDCEFEPSFKKVQFLLQGAVQQENILHSQESGVVFTLAEPMTGAVKFHKPLYRISQADSINDLFKSLNLSSPQIDVNLGQMKLYSISNMLLQLRHTVTPEELMSIICSLRYDSESESINLTQADLALNTTIKLVPSSSADAESQMVTIHQLTVGFTEAKLDLKGDVLLAHNKIPVGKLFVELHNYDVIVDKLMPEGLVAPKQALKSFIAEVSEAEGNTNKLAENDAEFEIVLSNDSIKVGTLNLMDLKKEH